MALELSSHHGQVGSKLGVVGDVGLQSVPHFGVLAGLVKAKGVVDRRDLEVTDSNLVASDELVAVLKALLELSAHLGNNCDELSLGLGGDDVFKDDDVLSASE